jgi:hypothetical protein
MKLRFPPTRYRVVRDSYLGYEAQFRPWWSPFWQQCNFVNTNGTIERARQVCVAHANGRGAPVAAQFSARELEPNQ